MHKSKILAAAAVVSMLVLAGCGGPGEGDGQDESIVIGLPIAMSGPYNAYDAPMLAGAKIAAERINAKGGLLGKKLTIVTSDHKSDIGLVETAALEVLDKGAVLVIPTHDYDVGSPAARAANDQEVIVVGGAGDPRFGASGIGPYVYNAYKGGATEGAAAATFAIDEKGWNSAFVLEDSSANYSKSFTKYFAESFAALGGTAVGSDTFLNADTSIAAQISKIRSVESELDFIFLASYLPGGASAVKQIRDAGIELPIVSGAGFDGTFWLDGLPGLKDFYAMVGGVTTPGNDPDSLRRDIFQAYADEYGKESPLGSQLLTGYTAVQAFALAAERAGTTDGPAVKAEMDKFSDEPFAAGATTFTPDCHIPAGPWVVVTFVDGAEEFVAEVQAREVGQSVC